MLIFIFCSSAWAFDSASESEPPQISAASAVLIDYSAGTVMYAADAVTPRYPASTTKIMTCYLTLKYGNVSDIITLPEGILEGMDESSSTAGLSAGEVISVRDLLNCLMIASANEAANALAIHISGSVDAFVDLMNQEAQELGCTCTHFVNPNGLHDEDHYTCASDLAVIAGAAMQFDLFREIVSTSAAALPPTNLSGEKTLSNTNYLLPDSAIPLYQYPDATGIKTGFTTPAGYCLVASASRNGRTLLAVVLHSGYEVNADGSRTMYSFFDAAKLFDWGFSQEPTVNSPDTGAAAESPAPVSEPAADSAAEPDSPVDAPGSDSADDSGPVSSASAESESPISSDQPDSSDSAASVSDSFFLDLDAVPSADSAETTSPSSQLSTSSYAVMGAVFVIIAILLVLILVLVFLLLKLRSKNKHNE